MKRGKQIQINLSNRTFYTLLVVSVLVLFGIGVYALVPSIDISQGYHESNQISVSISGTEKTLQEAIDDGDLSGGGSGGSGGINIHFPDGVWGAEIIRKEIYGSDGRYTVPSDKTLYISTIWNEASNPEYFRYPYDELDNFEVDGKTDLTFPAPLPVAGGTQIAGGLSSSYPLVIYGYLVPTNLATAVRAEIYSSSYIVPSDKTLYIVAIYNTVNTQQYLRMPYSDEFDNIRLDGYELLRFAIPLPVVGGDSVQGGGNADYPLVIYGYLR